MAVEELKIQMRSVALIAGLLCLTACGGNDVPSPSEREAKGLTAPNPEVEDEILLNGKGLKAGAEGFFFGAGQNEAIGSTTKLLGDPVRTASNDECGAGPMASSDFAGGLTLNFQNGVLVGWLWQMPREGDAAPVVPISLQSDTQLGTSRADLEATDGYLAIPDSTLGEEFSLGDAIGGFVEGDAVSMLYSGTQCFFR
ncbi:MAG: aspartate-semialdehyde dehydrogenase [Pseudomonadota bacterium]